MEEKRTKEMESGKEKEGSQKEESIVWPTEDTVAEIIDQYKVGVGSYRATCLLQTQFIGTLQGHCRREGGLLSQEHYL